MHFKISYAILFNLDQSKILLSGNGLNLWERMVALFTLLSSQFQVKSITDIKTIRKMPFSTLMMICILRYFYIFRTYGSDIVLSFNNIGKKPPTFLDAGYIAENILNLDMKFDIGNMYYNVFKSVLLLCL